MKTKYRGHEIDVTREKSMGGWSTLYFSVFTSEGRECLTSFEDSAETVRDKIGQLKDRIDSELSSDDPWGFDEEDRDRQLPRPKGRGFPRKMMNTPETIYLINGEDVEGAPAMVWCEDPAPGEGMDPADAVAYIRADKHQEIIDRQAKAAKMGMDAAKKSAAIMKRNAKQMRAESSPEALESERAANAMLTDRVEELETMVKVFRGCIETGLIPELMSPCYQKVISLVGRNADDQKERNGD